MALKQFNPTTPSRRGLVLIDRQGLWKGDPEKSLTKGSHKSGGRNNAGRITSRRIGGGHKRRYRVIDFKRAKFDVPATVERLEYDPNRTAFIALIKYEDGERAYILAPQRLTVGDTVMAGVKADIRPGNALPLTNIPVGTIIHNVEMKVSRAVSWRVHRRLCSTRRQGSRLRQLRLASRGSHGSRRMHGDHWRRVQSISKTKLGKAGRSRWLGKRPSVRDVAMNRSITRTAAADRTSGGHHPVTPWGKPTGAAHPQQQGDG